VQLDKININEGSIPSVSDPAEIGPSISTQPGILAEYLSTNLDASADTIYASLGVVPVGIFQGTSPCLTFGEVLKSIYCLFQVSCHNKKKQK
jgi:hypothetical protein